MKMHRWISPIIIIIIHASVARLLRIPKLLFIIHAPNVLIHCLDLERSAAQCSFDVTPTHTSFVHSFQWFSEENFRTQHRSDRIQTQNLNKTRTFKMKWRMGFHGKVCSYRGLNEHWTRSDASIGGHVKWNFNRNSISNCWILLPALLWTDFCCANGIFAESDMNSNVDEQTNIHWVNEIIVVNVWTTTKFTAGDNVRRTPYGAKAYLIQSSPNAHAVYQILYDFDFNSLYNMIRPHESSECSIFENDDLHRRPTCQIMRLKGFRWYIRQAVTH